MAACACRTYRIFDFWGLGSIPRGGPLKVPAHVERPVLLIEDDAETRDAMRALLVAAGHRVIASDEGRKALELAAVMRPAVVVLDLVTEGMDGWEFLERRAGVPALSDVPVIVVTGSSRELPGEATAVFRKPVDPRALLDKVGAIMRAARP
jgi:two-component system, OmpR family, alkaline phosphatase synthesis response regulator PhoP